MYNASEHKARLIMESRLLRGKRHHTARLLLPLLCDDILLAQFLKPKPIERFYHSHHLARVHPMVYSMYIPFKTDYQIVHFWDDLGNVDKILWKGANNE